MLCIHNFFRAEVFRIHLILLHVQNMIQNTPRKCILDEFFWFLPMFSHPPHPHSGMDCDDHKWFVSFKNETQKLCAGGHIFSVGSTCALVIGAKFLVSASCLSPQIPVGSILCASLESWCQCLPYKTIMCLSCGALYCSMGSSFHFPLSMCSLGGVQGALDQLCCLTPVLPQQQSQHPPWAMLHHW